MTSTYKQYFCFFAALILHSFISTSPSSAQCSDNEITATFLVKGILPNETLSMQTLFITTVGEETFPSETEMTDSITDNPYVNNYILQADFGDFLFFYAHPSDFGAEALIDKRSGAIAYSALKEWWSAANVTVPTHSNFDPTASSSTVTNPPESIQSAVDPYWYNSLGDPEAVTSSVMDFVLSTEILVSFSQCGPYSSIVYLSTPNPQGFLLGHYAVVVVSGICGPPWNGAPVSVENLSWGQVKGIYR